MSAVAPVDSLSASVPASVSAEAAVATDRIQAAEQKRWMIFFGLPMLVAAVFVGAVFATGQDWYMGPALTAIVLDISVLVWLAMSSDTNGQIGDTAH